MFLLTIKLMIMLILLLMIKLVFLLMFVSRTCDVATGSTPDLEVQVFVDDYIVVYVDVSVFAAADVFADDDVFAAADVFADIDVDVFVNRTDL